MQASRRRIIKSKNLKRDRSTGKTYLGLPTLSSSLGVSVSLSLSLPRPLSHSVSILPPLWQTAPPAFFMFGCCRRGINLLFVAVNQISTDRFKLIASVSWSPKKRVLQAPISFYSPSDILINDTRVHARMHTHTHTHRIRAHFSVCQIFLSVIGTLAKDLESMPAQSVMTLYLCNT